MSAKRNGIGVLSLSVKFVHLIRWPHGARSGPVDACEPALFAGVNFDDATRLPADVAELPDGSTLRTRWSADAGPEPWHGFQLRSLSDLLHLEIRDARADAGRRRWTDRGDPSTPSAGGALSDLLQAVALAGVAGRAAAMAHLVPSR